MFSNKKYFVSYYLKTSKGARMRNTEIERKDKIEDLADIRDIEDSIRKDYPYSQDITQLVIINYKLM